MNRYRRRANVTVNHRSLGGMWKFLKDKQMGRCVEEAFGWSKATDGDGMRCRWVVAVAVVATIERASSGGSKASRRWVQNMMQIFISWRDSSNDTH